MKIKESSKNKRALTVDEAADYACVSRSTVDSWINKRIIPFEELPSCSEKKVYRFIRIRKDDLDAFLDKHRVVTEEQKVIPIPRTKAVLLPKSA